MENSLLCPDQGLARGAADRECGADRAGAANRNDILGVLVMLLERWAVSAGLAAERGG